MSWFIRKAIKPVVEKAVSEVIERELPSIVRREAGKAVKKDPNRALTEIGFGWALIVALQEHWPDVDDKTAARWLWEYLEVPFGTSGHEWNYRAAKSIADQYVAEFGERG